MERLESSRLPKLLFSRLKAKGWEGFDVLNNNQYPWPNEGKVDGALVHTSVNKEEEGWEIPNFENGIPRKLNFLIGSCV